MKKKAYIIPGTIEVIVEPKCLMITISAGGDEIVNEEEGDNTDIDNRSRRRTYNVWEDEELEEEDLEY